MVFWGRVEPDRTMKFHRHTDLQIMMRGWGLLTKPVPERAAASGAVAHVQWPADGGAGLGPESTKS